MRNIKKLFVVVVVIIIIIYLFIYLFVCLFQVLGCNARDIVQASLLESNLEIVRRENKNN